MRGASSPISAGRRAAASPPSPPASGQVTAWDPSAAVIGENRVYALAVSGNTVYAGGVFSSIGGQPRNNIAALDASSGQASAWNPNADNGVNTLVVSGSTVYAGGGFTQIGGQTRICIAALDASSGLATLWNPTANGEVRALAVSGNTVYTGQLQQHRRADARQHRRHRRQQWAGYPVEPQRQWRGAGAGGKREYGLRGGNFSSIGGQTRNNIAALDASSGQATPWDPSADSRVYALAVSDTLVVAAVSSPPSAARSGAGLRSSSFPPPSRARPRM